MGLSHETFQGFSNRIKGVDVDESTKEYAKSLEKIANDRALKMLSKSERENLKKIAVLLAKEEFYIDEANLNDYVKKFKMKMGDKTSTADKDAWVDGIGGLTKREKTTLKRVLEEVEVVEDSIDEVDSSGVDMYDNKRKESEMRKKARETPSSPETKRKLKIVRAGGTVKLPEGQKEMQFINSLKRPQYSIKNTKTGQNYSTSKYQDDKKLDKIRKGGGDHKHAAHYKDGKVIDEYVGTVKKKESVKKHGYPNQNPKKDKYTGYVEGNKKTFAELSTGLLKRAASGARKDASTQRDAQAWAKRVPGKGHAFGADEAGKKAAKREKQAGKFSAAADVKDRNTAFKKEGKVNELGPIAGFVAKAAVRHIAKKAVSKVISRKEEENVNELSKELLDRAAQAAKKKAGQQRAVSDRAASRVGDTSQPPGQNIKSKRADFQASKKDYQAFKFGVAAKKKERVDESNKLQANMALDDAGIKSYWEDGKLWVDKKDVMKAEKTLSKSFKKGGEPHIYYKGGFLGVWNKKRKITG